MKRTLILSTIAVLLTAASIVYFAYFRPGQAESKAANANANNNEKLQTKVIAAPGVVESVSEEIEVGAELAGKLKSVSVEEGDEVLKGQIIAVLENADFVANIATAKSQIEILRSQRATAKARLSQAETEKSRIANGARTEERREAKAGYEQTLPNVENARRELARRENLYKNGDISREEFERAQTAFQTSQKQSVTMRESFNVVNASARNDDLAKADANVEVTKAQIAEFDALINEAGAKVRQAEANLSKTVVRAPITGVVVRKRLHDGETVSPENQTGIVTLADVSALRVRVDVDEIDVAKLKIGQTAFVTADAFDNQKFTAKIIKIGNILGRKNFRTERPTEKVDTKILEILLELDKNSKLPLGLRVDAFISND